MSNRFGLKSSDLEYIIAILAQNSNVEQAFIFGSRAKGTYKNGSDVDIALKGKSITPEVVERINYLLNEESPMPYKFDVLNYHTINNHELVEHIDRVGVEIYCRITN